MKCIIVDLYSIYDGFSKELIEQEQLGYKNRIAIYNYDLRKLEDFAILDDWKPHFKIGMIIEDWEKFLEEVINTPMNTYEISLNIRDIEILISKLNTLKPTDNFDLEDINETKLYLIKYRDYLQRINEAL